MRPASFQYPAQRVLSGGQTGVDRAALDWALRHGVPHGGWCPRGRRAEDGAIPAVYRLRETPSAQYEERTLRNVRDSNGTLILNCGKLEGGTLLTAQYCERLRKPHLLIRLDDSSGVAAAADVLRWLSANSISVLNVAGPRESRRPGIYRGALAFLEGLAR